MAQAASLISTLKRELKSQGKTYLDVAEALELSEASVKRLFSEQNFTLQRLEFICELLNMPLSELVQKMAREQKQLSQLSREQETVIADDLLLLLIAVSVVSGMTFDDILEGYEITEHQCVQKLAQLDRLQLIDLLPGNQ